MIILREIDQSNFNECMGLERKSQKYVGDSSYVLAEAYIYRQHSTVYGIYNDEQMVGLVTLRDRPTLQKYSFTDLFIADNYQNKGYAKETVKKIIEKFKIEGKADTINLCVHETNGIALKIYKDCGFREIKRATWDNSFIECSMAL